MNKLVTKSKLLPKGLAPIRETNHEHLESKADQAKSDDESAKEREFWEFIRDESLPGQGVYFDVPSKPAADDKTKESQLVGIKERSKNKKEKKRNVEKKKSKKTGSKIADAAILSKDDDDDKKSKNTGKQPADPEKDKALAAIGTIKEEDVEEDTSRDLGEDKKQDDDDHDPKKPSAAEKKLAHDKVKGA
jgi:hypothetical protein